MSEKLGGAVVIFKGTCKCNLNCEYCYDKYNRATLVDDEVSLEVVDHTAKLLSKLAKNVEWIWHGGEPTLLSKEFYTEASNLISQHYEANFTQVLQSNGINFIADPTWFDSLENAGIEYGVSFDMLGQSSRISNCSDTLIDKYCDLILDMSLRRDRERLGFLTVVTSKSIHQLNSLFDFVTDKFPMTHIEFSLLYTHQNHEPEDNRMLEIPIPILREKLLEFYEKMLMNTDEYAFTEWDFKSLSRLLLKHRKSTSCHFTDCRRSRLGIHPNGDAMYCDTPYKLYPLGKITDYNSMEELYNSENYIKISNEIQERYDNECSKCNYWNHCAGECHHLHVDVNGHLNHCRKYTCDKIQTRLMCVYETLQKVTSSEINPSMMDDITSDGIFVPQEVQKALNELGYTKSILIPNITNKFIIDPRYKLVQMLLKKDMVDPPRTLFDSARITWLKERIVEMKSECEELLSQIQE